MRSGVLLMAFALAGLLLASFALAYANGSNDVSKGIATLVGSGVTEFKSAVAWGAFWTFAGAAASAFAAQGLVATFSGSGFLARPAEGAGFLAAVSIGAVAWVALATRTGLPVSTTHAIAGALAGAGMVAQGASALHWKWIGQRVALPLALSPVLSTALLLALYPILRRGLSKVDRYCVCVEKRAEIGPDGAAALAAVSEAAVVAPREECASSFSVAGRINVTDALHWFSAALTSLARGLNDTPKIVALGAAAAAYWHVAGIPFFLAVAVAMGAGSLVSGLRVTETLARGVTRMSPTEGFSANLATSALVGLASLFSLPVSTTHVSSGAIIGIGLHRGSRSVSWGSVRGMALAWLVTLPASGLAAAIAYRGISSILKHP